MNGDIWLVEGVLETFYKENPKSSTPYSLKEHLKKVYDVDGLEIDRAVKRVRRRLRKHND